MTNFEILEKSWSLGTWYVSTLHHGKELLCMRILNDNSGRALVGPAETIENDAVFDRFGAVFDRLGAVFDRKRRRNEAFEFDSNCQAP